MKTTVEIPDSLVAQVREVAEREETTLRALIEEALRHLVRERQEEKPFRLEKASVKGNGLQPEFADAGWDKIRDAIYEGRGA